MKKTIIIIVAAVLVLILGIVGAKVFLFSGDKEPADNSDVPTIPITTQDPAQTTDTTQTTDIPAVTPIDPNATTGSDEPMKLYDNGMASFTYDSTKLAFDEIPPSEENGVPMVSFMPVDSENALPRVDAMPLTISATGDGKDNFYNITEDDWKNLAAACVLQYLSPISKDSAQIAFSGAVVKPDGDSSMKLFTNISVTIPDDVAAQTGDFSMNGSIRMIASGEKAMVTMAMYRQNASLPAEMTDVYMSMQLH